VDLTTSRLRVLRWPGLFLKILFLLKREITERQSPILLREFWDSNTSLDKTKLFLLDLAANCKKENTKVCIDSVFPELPYKAKRLLLRISRPWTSNQECYKLWYSPENHRPAYSEKYSSFLGFDLNSTTFRRLFLPLWATELGPSIDSAKNQQDLLLKSRELNFTKTKFACIVISNPEPTRLAFLKELQKIGIVDCFGPAFGNRIDDKHAILKEYRFNLCFENDVYPNYVTEKIFQSYAAECIPIWWGFDSEGYVNSQAIIDVSTLGIEESLKTISFLEKNLAEQNEMRKLPILKKGYDYDFLVSQLSLYLKDPI
jgi:hypothetical protein